MTRIGISGKGRRERVRKWGNFVRTHKGFPNKSAAVGTKNIITRFFFLFRVLFSALPEKHTLYVRGFPFFGQDRARFAKVSFPQQWNSFLASCMRESPTFCLTFFSGDRFSHASIIHGARGVLRASEPQKWTWGEEREGEALFRAAAPTPVLPLKIDSQLTKDSLFFFSLSSTSVFRVKCKIDAVNFAWWLWPFFKKIWSFSSAAFYGKTRVAFFFCHFYFSF